MKRNDEKKQNLRIIIGKRLKGLKDDNRGIAMIVSLVVGVVAMAFCLSLLMISYSLYAQTNRKLIQKKCALLAQTSLEAVEKELLDIDSELNNYLYEQLESGLWMSVEEGDSNGNNPSLTGSIALLEFDLKHDGAAPLYEVKAVFSYSINDDEEDDTVPENPGEVNNPSGEENQGENPVASASSYTVYVKITVSRGDKNDRDYQSYSVSDEYYTVIFN